MFVLAVQLRVFSPVFRGMLGLLLTDTYTKSPFNKPAISLFISHDAVPDNRERSFSYE